MRLAIDLRPFQLHQHRGIGTYLLNLLDNLPAGSDIQFIFLRFDSSDPIREYKLVEETNYKEVVVSKHSFSKQPVALLRYVLNSLIPGYGKLRRFRPDVFLQTDYLLGAPRLPGCKIVVVAHDLIPFRFKAIYLPSWRKYFSFRQLSRKARLRLMLKSAFYTRKYKNGLRLLRRAHKVISISHHTAKDLVEIARVKQSKIQVIHLAPSFRVEADKQPVRPEITALIKDLKMPYMVFIGGTDRRRQVEELVFAYNLYNSRQTPLALLLIGNEFTGTSTKLSPLARDAITNSSFRDNIHMLGKLSEAEKRYLLEQASAFVYPTLYEGFGMPVLEAMAVGCPVIAYKNSSVAEIGGKAALYTDRTGGYSIYLSLQKLLTNTELQQELRHAGQKRAAQFSWQKTAEATWQVLTSTKKLRL